MAPTNQQSRAAKTKKAIKSGAGGGSSKAITSGSSTSKGHVQRYLKSIEPQLTEQTKNSLLLKGTKCSDAMGKLLKDLRSMQAPNCKLLGKKNPIWPFDTQGQLSIEFLTTKNDCTMFGLASHTKKRPNNFIMGRTFDHQILDMVEFGIMGFKSMQDYNDINKKNGEQKVDIPKKRIGSKPLMLFLGETWLQPPYNKLQNLLIDFYRGDVVDKLVLSGLDHIIVFTITAQDQQQNTQQLQQQQQPKIAIHQRTYFVKLKKNPNPSKDSDSSSPAAPLPFLIPCGPDIDYSIRREQWALPDVWKMATKTASSSSKKKLTHKKAEKNQSTNIFGETLGRLHLEKQNIDKMQGRKSKALRKAEKIQVLKEQAEIENELQREKEEMGEQFKQDYGFDAE